MTELCCIHLIWMEKRQSSPLPDFLKGKKKKMSGVVQRILFLTEVVIQCLCTPWVSVSPLCHSLSLFHPYSVPSFYVTCSRHSCLLSVVTCAVQVALLGRREKENVCRLAVYERSLVSLHHEACLSFVVPFLLFCLFCCVILPGMPIIVQGCGQFTNITLAWDVQLGAGHTLLSLVF